ncbi:uncharacterized protein BXZ73DRAFT_99183 [Epithele typhae]|uniref:uncharacterized protein n=1 Tax=Epithele typhae TaxID=378194 RepID=UPI002007BD4E|nr:uncharacterized protein BXZ73DRAFT_99183 [Epithele typhae]KAH9940187.1 hypothetical protein BXZ73DRAFT_99183 [Epithele typhae]
MAPISILLVSAFALAAFAAPAPIDTNPAPASAPRALTLAAAVPMSNAQRLARGLPPNPPVLPRRAPSADAHAESDPHDLYPRAYEDDDDPSYTLPDSPSRTRPTTYPTRPTPSRTYTYAPGRPSGTYTASTTYYARAAPPDPDSTGGLNELVDVDVGAKRVHARWVPEKRSGAARAEPSAYVKDGCGPKKGVLAAAVEGREAGYIARAGNAYGEYGFTTDVADALVVLVSDCNKDEYFDIAALNGYKDFPYLGAVTGYLNSDYGMEKGSPNFVYLVGTDKAPYGPAEDGPSSYKSAVYAQDAATESHIWSFAPYSKSKLAPSWVNPDGYYVAPTVVFVEASQAFALVGDVAVFAAKYGAAYVAELEFKPY